MLLPRCDLNRVICASWSSCIDGPGEALSISHEVRFPYSRVGDASSNDSHSLKIVCVTSSKSEGDCIVVGRSPSNKKIGAYTSMV